MFRWIVVITAVVFIGSTGLLVGGLILNSNGAPPYDLAGASGIATVAPSFAGVLLAAIAVYMYVRVEDPLLKKSEEVLHCRGVLMRLLDDVPLVFLSSIQLGRNLHERDQNLEEADKKVAAYFANVSSQLLQISAIFKETALLDALIRTQPDQDRFFRETALQIGYYGGLLKDGQSKEPITGADLRLLVCDTCEQLRNAIDLIEFSNSHAVYAILTRPYDGEKSPYSEYRKLMSSAHAQQGAAAVEVRSKERQ